MKLMTFYYTTCLFQVRGISVEDFLQSLQRIRRSVPQGTLQKYEEWNRDYGAVAVWQNL